MITPPIHPRVCPACRLAMQATNLDGAVVHTCHACGLTVTIGCANKDAGKEHPERTSRETRSNRE